MAESQPPSEIPPVPQAPEVAETGDDPYIGKMVADRYRILSKLGEGGMGAVYLAEHVFIEKKVALKLLHGEYAHKQELVTRFLHEAKAASKIDHPNVVQITDFGQTDSGNVFFAMEYLKGEDLSAHIKRDGSLKWKRARSVGIQMCRALQAAHEKGVIHRDMKPENVLLIEREGNPDFVKVLDFGIAKMSGLENEHGQRLTRTGMIFGTPEYMSPEQARGDKPDHRVDIYAVGCILFEMLTGQVPFHADTFMGVLTKHMFDPVAPPRKVTPGADIPPAAEAIILKALEKPREKRYASMAEMAEALLQCPVEITEVTRRRRARTPLGVPSPGGDHTSSDDLSFPTELGEDEEFAQPRRGLGLYIGLAVAVAAALGAIGVLRHGSSSGEAAAQASPSPAESAAKPPVAPVAGAPSPAGAPEAAAVAAPPVPPPNVAPPTECPATLSSVPPGATVAIADQIVGQTPYTLRGRCGGPPTHAVLRAHGYRDLAVDVPTDAPGGNDLRVKLVPVEATRAAFSSPARHAPATRTREERPARQPTGPAEPKDLHNPFE